MSGKIFSNNVFSNSGGGWAWGAMTPVAPIFSCD